MTNAQRDIIRQAVGGLAAAISQSVPSDDQIILGYVREAHESLRPLFFVETAEESQSREGIIADVNRAYSPLIASVPADGLYDALNTLHAVVGLTAIKHASQLPALQEAMNTASAALAKARGEAVPR